MHRHSFQHSEWRSVVRFGLLRIHIDFLWTQLMRKTRLTTIAFCVAFCFQAPFSLAELTSTELDEFVVDAMSKLDVAGAAIGIVKDGSIIHRKGYGVRSLKTKERVNEHTNFQIASNSKAFTTAALAILIDEGKLSWNDKVVDHIPEFKMYNAYVTHNLTIEDLLTHRSGLGAGAGDLMFLPDGSDFGIDDVLGGFQHFKPVSAFRTKHHYNNLLYLAAGEVIARKTGMTYGEFVCSRIFKPLGMDKSYPWLHGVTERRNLATPHSNESGPLREIDHFTIGKQMNGAAGGIVSNVDDLCQWLLLQLNQGRYGNDLNERVFSSERQDEMWTIYSSESPEYKGQLRGYGLGWHLETIPTALLIEHGGALPGMASKTVLVPAKNLGFVVLTNGNESNFCEAVRLKLLGSYLLNIDYKLQDERVKAVKETREKKHQELSDFWNSLPNKESNSASFENYKGVFEDCWFGKVEVFQKNDQLWIKSLRSPRLNGRMHFYRASTFAVKWEYQDLTADAFAVFNVDETGEAQSVTLKAISKAIDFSFDFHDLDLRRVQWKESK